MRYLGVLLLVPVVGCSLPKATPPAGEFLVADGAATYWVTSGPAGVHARVSPLVLTRVGGKYYEVYVGEETRSYEDAVFTREPIIRRDLLTGDSTILFEDRQVDTWERVYLSNHPSARLLDPDENGDDQVAYAASSEADIVGVLGPYVLYTHRSLIETTEMEQADTARGIIDVRFGKPVAASVIAHDTAAIDDGGIASGHDVKWKHAGYEVVARYDAERGQTELVLRAGRREWPLGHIRSRRPRIFWLDEPRLEREVRDAISEAFDGAISDDERIQLVSRHGIRGLGRAHTQ
ncbi:MAG TPA: hypothetical protein VIF83_05865 [Gemmatimonadaceae bacterium]|jgi:hypothetical protein